MSEGTHVWSGKSGRSYVYRIYQLPPRMKRLAGNYIFAKRTEIGGWLPVYIGQTDDLSKGPRRDPPLECVRANGATHLHAHAHDGDQAARRLEVDDLLELWSPPCS